MALETKRKKMVVSVTATTLIAAFISIFLLASAISGSPSSETSAAPSVTNTASQSAVTETATQAAASTPKRTTPKIYSNSPYDINYSTSKKPHTPSVTTPTPTVVTPPPHEDAKLEFSEIKLIEFNAETAKYKIELKFNQSGKVKIVATNSEQKLTINDITSEYIRNDIFNNKDYSLLAKNQSVSIAERDVNANENVSFEITASVDKFDLFIILDGNDENEYMKEPLHIPGRGGVPTVKENLRYEIDSNTNEIICYISTTLDTEVNIRLYKSGYSFPVRTEKKTTTDCTAKVVIDKASSYAGCLIKITLKYNNIIGGEWILTDSLQINNDDD